MKRILALIENGKRSENVSRKVVADKIGKSQFFIDKNYLANIAEGTETSIEVDKGIVLEVKWAEGGAVRKAKDPNAPKKEKKAKDPNAPKKERKAKAKKETVQTKGVYIVERNQFEEQREFDNLNDAVSFFDEGKDIEDVNETSIYIQGAEGVDELDSWVRPAVEQNIA